MLAWGDIVKLGRCIELDNALLITPQKIDSEEQVKVISAGDHGCCMLFNNGKVCAYDKTGTELVDFLADIEITELFGGGQHSFAVASTGEMFAWGLNNKGQLGFFNESDEIHVVSVPRKVAYFNSKRVIQVACGKEHTLVLTCDGTAFAMGANSNGQLGLGCTSPHENPSRVISLQGLPLRQIQAGSWHSFCVTLSGVVFSWGRNDCGQLGLGDHSDRNKPTQIKLLASNPVSFVAAGERHSVVLTEDGGVFTFGSSLEGQLGHGTMHESEVNPRKVCELMGSTVTQVACGDNHTIAYVPGSNNIFAWGCGEKGQLGQRGTDRDPRKEPTMILGPWHDCVGIESQSSEYQKNVDGGSSQLKANRFVKKIVATGNQTFVILGDTIHQHVDFRRHEEGSRICKVDGGLCERLSLLCKEDSLSAEDANQLGCTMTSHSCINASFLSPDCQVTDESPALDFDSMKSIFSRLVECKNEEVISILCAAVKNLLESLGTSVIGLESLRIFLILPKLLIMLPLDLSSFNKFASTMLQLPKAYVDVLNKWYRSQGSEQFMTTVNLCKKYIVANINTNRPNVPPVVMSDLPGLSEVLKLIQRLDRVNVMDYYPRIVSFQEFYVPELSVRNYLAPEYGSWITGRPGFCDFPFLLDAEAKSLLMQIDARAQMLQEVKNDPFMPISLTIGRLPANNIVVSRSSLVEDSLQQIRSIKNLKRPFEVTFKGEEGQDYGGVRKEYFMLILEELLSPNHGLFIENEDSRFIWFSHQNLNDLYEFVGIICGLAIYSSTIINISFPLALYKKLLNKEVTLADLKEFDPLLGCNLQQLLDYEEDDEDTVEDLFCLAFTAPRNSSSELPEHELVENGANVPVTAENRERYVKARVDYLFNVSVNEQFSSFRDGFLRVCGGKVLSLFRPIELMEMIAGNENYNWRELEKAAIYDGYSVSDQVIVWFWEVFHAMTPEEKKQFLIFLTGTSKIPLKGLQILIRKRDGADLLPVAHTCFEPPHLFLPCYLTKDDVETKLKMAIKCKGFHIA